MSAACNNVALKQESLSIGLLMKNPRKRIFIFCLAATVAGILHAGTPALDRAVVEFRKTCDRAMDNMMAGMSEPSTNNVDRDFVQMMVPHHQAAIDMAMAELRHGRNEQLRRIAQEIIVDQQQEIDVMNMAVRHAPNDAQPQPGSDDIAPPKKEAK